MKRSLLLGCGHDRRKKVALVNEPNWIGDLVTLDMNRAVNPTVVWDLEKRPLPFDNGFFDEIGAYDVLEHVGRQGDWRGWFDEMAEYHRILKSGGTFGILVPIGADAFADPGHTRFISPNHFGFLTEGFYEQSIASGAPVTDYRFYIDRWWEILHMQNLGHHLAVAMRTV